MDEERQDVLNPEDFEPLDLSVFKERAKMAVHCPTEEEALQLLAAMKLQYPDKCETWEWPDTEFCCYESITAYCVGLHPEDEYSRMMYGTVESFKITGYEVIPFSDLVIEEELDESSQSLDFLFGGVVNG